MLRAPERSTSVDRGGARRVVKQAVVIDWQRLRSDRTRVTRRWHRNRAHDVRRANPTGHFVYADTFSAASVEAGSIIVGDKADTRRYVGMDKRE